MKYLTLIMMIASAMTLSCGNAKSGHQGGEQTVPMQVVVPSFNADSAYSYVKRQVDFGPRVPGSDGHKACAAWLEQKLAGFGAKIYKQNVQLQRYDGALLDAVNIIASFDPDNVKRVMLCAHWDTRPWADNDDDPANHHTPILGANDGGSGVGVLLEVARQIAAAKPAVGIDIMLFDAEDSGTPRFDNDDYDDRSWCLGAQYWAHNPHRQGYTARYGLLLDMVGAADAVFYREGFSQDYAPSVIDKVWDKAAQLGYSHLFVNDFAGYISDDHVPVNEIARIPCIDIIHNDPTTTGFGTFWHTVDDDMDIIDKQMLGIVGAVVLNVIYNEK